MSRPFLRRMRLSCTLAILLLLFSVMSSRGAETKSETKKKEFSNLRVEVTGEDKLLRGIPVFASVRDEDWSNEETTNGKGVASFSAAPRGRVLIQVNQPEWEDFGDYFDLSKAEESIHIKLQKKKPSKSKDR